MINWSRMLLKHLGIAYMERDGYVIISDDMYKVYWNICGKLNSIELNN